MEYTMTTKPEHEHELKETITVDVWYPDHPPRKESALFGRTKRKLVSHDDVPCYICGSKKDREVHHFHVEWAFADGVDWERMKTLHPKFDWSTFKSAEDFVDSEYNMMVLCAEHHRHTNHGIHNLPYPIWIMQQHAKAGFVMYVEGEKGA
jgi:hypothetical protein